MTEGLIYSFEGRVGICVGLLILGGFVTIALTVFAYSLRSASDLVLAASALRGGRALSRGVAHDLANKHGTGWWFRLFVAVFMAPPLLALIFVCSVEVFHRAPLWLWPAATVAAGVGAWFMLRGRSTPVRQPVNPPLPVTVPADFEPFEPVGWFANPQPTAPVSDDFWAQGEGLRGVGGQS